MKQVKNEFFKGSIVLLLLFNISNLFNLVFQIFTARNLSLESYGVLTALLSIIYLFAIFSESIQLTVAQQTSSQISKSKIRQIYDYAFSKSLSFSLWAFVVYCILFFFLRGSLQIPFFLLMANGLTVFFAFLTPIARGVLQGQKRFYALGTSMALEGASKLIIAVLLVLLGLQVYGVVFAIILSMALPLIYARYSQMKDIFIGKVGNESEFSLFKYAPKVFIIMTSFILFFMLDAFIAKIVFSPSVAGTYAIISTISKTIFIGTQPISKAFFPISADKRSKNSSVFSKAFMMLGACLLISLIFVYFFPHLIISIFSGKDLGSATSALFIVALANAVLAIVNLMLFYRISKENYSGMMLFTICVALQVALLVAFNDSIYHFAFAFLTSTVIFLAATLYKLRW